MIEQLVFFPLNPLVYPYLIMNDLVLKNGMIFQTFNSVPVNQFIKKANYSYATA